MRKRNLGIGCLLLLAFFFCSGSYAQMPFGLQDQREHRYCNACQQVIAAFPPEVMFGISVYSNGDIYFSMNNKEWFDKLFRNNSYGVTVDIVSKKRYACNGNEEDLDMTLPLGTMLKPVYRPELLKTLDDLGQGYVYMKIGKVPQSMMKDELEGNLVIVNGNLVCYYSKLVNIERQMLNLLPMGLFTDSLLQYNPPVNASDSIEFVTYSKKISFEIPFARSSTVFNEGHLKRITDSIGMNNYRLKKVEIRAYASVEGPEKTNKELMNGRANAMIKALQPYHNGGIQERIIAAENWLEFYRDIPGTPFEDLNDLTRGEIKVKLADPKTILSIEPILSRHRKVITTLYLEDKTSEYQRSDTSLYSEFKDAVKIKDINRARLIQKELVDRIADNQLPLDYLDKLEVPRTKEFSPLLNDREVFKYLLKATSEYEALDNFLALRQLDPRNGRINYNICALRFFTWQFGNDSIPPKVLLKDIAELNKMGIDSSLTRRMQLNYHILNCEDQNRLYQYAKKDASLKEIKRLYEMIPLTDVDRYALARYFSFYAHFDWAAELIRPRIQALDVSEDLVFYYLSLILIARGDYDDMETVLQQAINLDPARFCRLFNSTDRGGISMQLLEQGYLRGRFCEVCR